MTQTPNPFAVQPGFGDPQPVAQRTSITAIVALVLSLLCFIPGFSVLGVLLAILALVFISGSNGRLVGKGMAFAALIIGLIASVIWIGIVVGGMGVARIMQSQFVGPVDGLMTAIEANDLAKARAQFTQPANQRMSDDDFARFRDAYQAHLGSFQRAPKGLMDFITLGTPTQQVIAKYQAKPGQVVDVFPVPSQFANAPAVVIIQFDPTMLQSSINSPAGVTAGSLVNVMIESIDGKRFTLFDPQGANVTTPTPPTPATPPDAPQPQPTPAGTP